MLQLPRLYPILDTAVLAQAGMQLQETAKILAAAGVRILQLRDKHGEPRAVLEQAAQLSEVFAGTGATLVMNDRVDLALLVGWSAVHVGQRDLTPEAARSVSSSRELLVGLSTHNAAQVEAADAGSADYIAIGPVFRTASKTDAEPVVGLEGVRRARQRTRKPLVAIGGITAENAPAVIDAGADAVAVIGALFTGAGGLDAAVRRFHQQLQ